MSEISVHSEIPHQKGPRITYGKERHPIPYFERTRNGQEHARDFAYVEESIAKEGVQFSFQDELKKVAQTFSESPELTVLDGGCGVGNMLVEIENIEGEIGKPVQTVGVTLEDHPTVIEELSKKDIDEVYIGGMKEFVEKNEDRKFHFIIDSSGYAYHDAGFDENKVYRQGENIIPLYSRMLYPGGKAFLTLGLSEMFYGKQAKQGVYDLLERNGLAVVQEMPENGYMLVEKQAEE